MSRIMASAALVAAAMLGGCVSFGGAEPPEKLLTLTPAATSPVGALAGGDLSQALAVSIPSTGQKLSVTRVPVQVDASSIAYLKDAVWVENPARLFASLLAETIRASSDRLVMGEDELGYAASTKLGGELVEMGYDARTASATIRYDALLQLSDGRVLTQRFENSVSGIPANAGAVGPALNQAANAVAAEVAAWVNASLG